MGTGSLVGISSYQEIAEQTAPGIGNAHGAVDKGLNLHILRDMGTDLANLLQGKLSGTDHSLGSKIVPETVGLIIGVVGLGADVALNLRTDFLGVGKNTGICDDQGIRLQFL